MESVSAFALGKSYLCRSDSDSLDKAAVHWKVCHAGSECFHTTQLFFLTVTSRRAIHIQTDGPHEHMAHRYISCKQLLSVSVCIHTSMQRIL